MNNDKPIDFQKKKVEILKKRRHFDDTQDIVICYIQGTDPDGEKVFSYIAIDGDLLDEFNAAIHEGNVDVDEYGFRIVSGYGEPTEAVKQMMVDDYGFDHETVPFLPQKPSNDV